MIFARCSAAAAAAAAAATWWMSANAVLLRVESVYFHSLFKKKVYCNTTANFQVL
jgi:hypothetical protein